jgi:hypothetical protein
VSDIRVAKQNQTFREIDGGYLWFPKRMATDPGKEWGRKCGVGTLNEKHISVQFIKENLTFTWDKSDPTSDLLLTLLGR